MATSTCVFVGCTSNVYVREMCSWHYRRVMRGELRQAEARPAPGAGGTWQEQAACRGTDPEAFFPLSERAGTPAVERARAICSGCPVRAVCLEWALTNQPFGIAGGLTTDERTQIRKGHTTRPLTTAGSTR